MNRYLLFHGHNYYPLGGMEDFKKSSYKIDNLLLFILEMKAYEWCHIYDCINNKIIFQSEDIGNINEIKYSWVTYEKDS